MFPSELPPEMFAKYPDLAYHWGKPGTIIPDNELALLGPSLEDALLDVGITLQLAQTDCPTAKASLERFNRSLKGALRMILLEHSSIRSLLKNSATMPSTKHL